MLASDDLDAARAAADELSEIGSMLGAPFLRASAAYSNGAEVEVAIAMLVDNPDGSQEIYEKVRDRLDLEASAGGILHVAGPPPTGSWRVIEVWDSVEEASAPRPLKAAGFTGQPPQPQFWPVYKCMK